MKVLDWSGPGEIKELQCGEKPIVVQCLEMGACPLWVCPNHWWQEHIQ